eukprot:9281324-Alexandrium_andersonii.AAC.1
MIAEWKARPWSVKVPDELGLAVPDPEQPNDPSFRGPYNRRMINVFEASSVEGRQKKMTEPDDAP